MKSSLSRTGNRGESGDSLLKKAVLLSENFQSKEGGLSFMPPAVVHPVGHRTGRTMAYATSSSDVSTTSKSIYVSGQMKYPKGSYKFSCVYRKLQIFLCLQENL